MKFKKLLLSLLLIVITVVSMAGCTTEYDDKEVVKIETQIYGGYTLIAATYSRMFDFSENTVTDEIRVSDKEMTIKFLLSRYNSDPEVFLIYDSAEQYEAFLREYYNVPKVIETFSQEQADKLLKKVKSLGIYRWKEEYINDMVDDASWHSITITFSDGTVKTTRFYCEYPYNFDRVKGAFNDNIGAKIWCN